jgi:preprotein translocase subunit SecE
MALKTYIKDSYNELVTKVSWPTWKELQSSSIVVMVATLIIAGVVLVMDTTFTHLMQDVIYNILN